jgi:hypothetical protein
MAQDTVKEAIKAVLRRSRGEIDPQQLDFPQPEGKGRRAGGRGLTQLQVDQYLGRAAGTYQRLESGRYPHAPERLLKEVADLLRLTEHEWAWLWHMTWRRQPPYPLYPLGNEQLHGGWRRLINPSKYIGPDSILLTYCTNWRWEMLGHNSGVASLFPGRPVTENSLAWTLLAPEARTILDDWEHSWAAQVVPHLWAARADHPDDPVLADMERRVLADKRCGPIYEAFGPIYVHADGAVRPMLHPTRGPGWVTICVYGPRSTSGCQVTTMIFDPGTERPEPLPPLSAIPA